LDQGPSEQELVERIKALNAASLGPDKFWGSFVRGELDSWDHYSHLRAGYFVMFEGMSRNASLLDCASHFLDYLKELREKNPERFRNTAHRYAYFTGGFK
jgi:ubiquitin carboxyl-terminal hydrolase L3